MERILALLSGEKDRVEFGKMLVVWGVGAFSCPDENAFRKDLLNADLDKTYDVILVDHLYCANERNTAHLVREIRKRFSGPMIALRIMGCYDTFALQVAGCNFACDYGVQALNLPIPAQRVILLDLIQRICQALDTKPALPF